MGEAVGVFIRGFKSWMDWLPIAATLLVGILCAQPALGSTTTVGTIAGQFSVSPTGAATYQIPLDLPPGVNGLKPGLALLYNSQAGNGFLGEGWSLTGLSVISRCPQTLDDQTPAIHIPDGTSADRFCLDGQRLILTSGTYGAAGSVYHTEIESFQQVTANGSAGGGPTSFTVVDRSGLTRQYSTVPFTLANGAALEWLITKITDRYGNFISFSYDVGFYDLNPNGSTAHAYGIQEIDYGNSQGAIVGRVLFTYDNGQTGSDRPDSHSTYVGATGVAVDVNAVILTGITVKDGNGAVLRTYNLSYNNTGFSPDLPPVTLASVQECAGDGTCFNPTSFTYSGATSDFYGGNQFGNDSAVQGPNFQVLDLDGDGLPDYVYAANSTVYVIFGNNLTTAVATSVPWGTSSQTGIGLQTAVVTDLNGGAQQELLVPYYSHPGVNPNTPSWYLLSWNGQAGTGANISAVPVPTTGGGSLSACAADDGCTPDAVAVDMSGNGEPGLLFADGGTLYYYANVSGALSSSAVNTGITYSGTDPKLIPVNYDGQGTPEVYVAGTGVVKWNRSSGVFQLIVSGNFGESNGNNVQFVNSSGLSSAVVITGSYWWFCPNNGQGFYFLASQNCQESVAPPSGMDVSQAQPVDYYGDGRQEILVPANSAWWLFNGVTFTQLSTVQVPYAGSNTEFIDVNGDGRADMLFTSNGHTEYYFNNASPYLLNQITNGLGHNTDVGYIPVDQATHGNYVNQPSPVINAPHIRAYMGPMYVVDDFAVDSGLSNSNGPEQIYTYYIYAGAALDQWGRGFLGFSEVEAINYNTGLYTKVTYDQNFPYTGMVTSSSKLYDSSAVHSAPSVGSGGVKITCTHANPGEPDCEVTYNSSPPPATFTTSGTPITTTTNTGLTDIAPYTGVHYPHVGQSTTQLFDLNTDANYETTTTNYTYQSFSGTPIGVDVMPTDINVNTAASAGGTTTTAVVDTQTGYGQESSCPGHATSVTVTDTYQGTQAQAKTETFSYDGNCFLTTDTKTIVGLPSGGSMTLTKQYTPDGYGNPVSSTVSGTNVAARTTTMSYDPTERFPVSITNALGQTENLSYNDWGEKLSDTDANGDSLTYVYYGLGRKKEVLGPEPAVHTKFNYAPCSSCVANAVYTVTQTGSDGSEVIGQYDELGRELESERLGFAGEWVIQDTQYDLLGRVAQVSTPYTNPAKPGQVICQDVKIYDVLNRAQQDTQPHAVQSGSCVTRTVSYAYSGLQTTKTISAAGTNIGSEQIITTLNALGKPAQVKDTQTDGTGGITSYSYDPWGDVTSVAPPDGNAVSMTYDSAGDKWSMHDPDMGAWSYTYDALGELRTQTDAKNQTVSNTYDALDRLVSRTEPEGTSLWKYDIAYGAGVGRLAYKQGPNGVWEGYAYDAYGHPTDKITVVNGQEYWVTTTYNDQGQVSQIAYPNLTGISVNNTPNTPAGLQASADPNNGAQIDLQWTLTQSGEIYHLYRTASGAAAPIDSDEIYSGPDANWPDDGVTTNGSYEWWLKACNDANCSGYATTTLTVTLPPTVPGAPNVPTSDTHAQSISLSWAGSSLVSTTAGPISYEILQSYTPINSSTPGAFTQVGTSSSASASVSLSQDGTYVFAVRACASGACSAPSLTSAPYLTHLLPGTPTNLYAAPNPSTNSNYSLYWTGPSSGGAVTSYTIYCSSGYCPAPTSNTSVALGGNADGTYSYYVKACNAVGCGPAGNTASETVLRPPGEPSSISLSPTSTYQYDTYTLSWGNASGTVTSYEVNGNLSYSASTFSASYSKFKAGNYTYYVQACNSSGCGPATATVTETVMSGTGGCKTCAPTNGATTAPTQSTSLSPTQAPSASSGSGGLAEVVLPALRLAASINLDQPLTVAPLIALSTPPIPPTVRIRPLAARPAFHSTPATAPIMSAREAFFLAHAGQMSQSTKPLIPSGSGERVADRNGNVSRSAALGGSVVWGGSGGLHRDSRRLHSHSELVAQTLSAPSFEKGKLVAQTLSAPSFEKGGLGRISATFAQTAWHYAPAIDPQLSEYPPLRRDPRVLAHFESLGGQLPGKVEQADCGRSDSDHDCSQPTGGTALMVGYAYNGQGYLAQVLKLDSGGNPVQALWQATDETALGQVDSACFDATTPSSPDQTTCNGQTLTVSDTYDMASGLLTGTTANASAGGYAVTASYSWDGYNNLLSRGMSETVPPGQTAPPTLNETFTYDALNRLSTISTNAGSYSGSESMNYNAVGGFLNKGSYTNYQYSNPGFTVSGYTYSQPHAVSRVTTPAGANRNFTYDANGNLLTESGDVNRSVIWTSYNKPSQITGNGAQETFVYGPDRSRLQTAITKGSDTVTTTYIDGLFEQVYDSTTGNLTYRHYILAGGARVGVETISANSGGTITADTLSFYVHDEVDSVIATVTENLGGANQTVALTSYNAWGKARPTSGGTAYQDLAPGSFYSPTPAGQEEGFAGHDNLSDTGLVDMEGRVYDPEVGSFLSADPNVQYPFSSQGYDRYIYVNDNPLSLSDPSGYFAGNQWLGLAAAIVVTVACEGTCTAMTTAFLAGAADGYISSGGNLQQTGLSGLEAMAFTYVGDDVNWGTTLEKSVAEGLIGGAFSEAGGGNFGDGFLGAFTSSELSPVIGSIGGDPNTTPPAVYYSAANMAARVVVSAVVGGTVAAMTGGDFTDGAMAAAMQRLFNEENSDKARQAALREDLENYLNDPRTQAMLMTIASGEGPGYNIEYGGETFNDFSTYPNGAIAAGAYQIQPKTWKWLSSVLGTSDFSSHTQDLMATYLLKNSGALNQLFKGDFDQAIFKASRWWSSLPADYSGQSYYPQYMSHVTPLPILEDIYHFELTTLTWDF